MMRRALVFLLTCAIGVSACGDDTTTPTNPSEPGTLAISPQSDFLTIGTAVTLQAMLTGTDGTPRAVAADWSVEDGRVAGIDRTGRLSALGSGTTNIRAVFEQRSATLAVRVAPDFAGAWTGRARVVGCSNPTPGVCERDYPINTQYVMRVTLVQSRDQVVGTLYQPYPATLPTVPLPIVDATLSGRIDITGLLPMSGSLVGATPTAPALGTIPDWRTERDRSTPVLRGGYTEVTTGTGGTSSISWEFIGLSPST